MIKKNNSFDTLREQVCVCNLDCSYTNDINILILNVLKIISIESITTYNIVWDLVFNIKDNMKK